MNKRICFLNIMKVFLSLLTIVRLAKRHGITVDKICKLYGIKANKIQKMR